MPRSGGAETTAVLLAHPHASVDVVPASPADRPVLEAAFGGRIGFSPQGLHDLVVVSPTLGEIIDMAQELPWLAARTLKPGGRLLMLTIRPDALGRKTFDQPSLEDAGAFRRRFRVFAGRIIGLPADLAEEFVLEAVVPRNPRSRSYVGWLVLRRRALSDPIRRLHQRLAKGVRALRDHAHAFAASVPLFTADDARDVLTGLADKDLARLLARVRHGPSFRTVMVSHNDFVGDPRVLRTAGAVPGPVLAIGIGDTASGTLSKTPAGDPLLLLPDLRARIGRRLRLIGAATDRTRWTELRTAACAASLVWILGGSRARGAVLHTHDFLALYMGGAALEALPEAHRETVRWVHDVHEYVRGYELIDAEIQAVASAWEDRWLARTHALTTVSPELAQQLAHHYPDAPKARVVLSSIPADQPWDSDVADLRTLYAIGGAPMVIHPGSLRQGRGVEHVIDALPQLPDCHLVLVGSGSESWLADLCRRATVLGVLDRVHFHGFEPSARLPALTAQADVGVIPMDSYGNAEVSLPNKLFIYVRAGVPVVATETRAMAHFMKTWPVGLVVPCADSSALADALAEVIARRDDFSAAITGNEALRHTVSWEAQARVLAALYAQLDATTSLAPTRKVQ